MACKECEELFPGENLQCVHIPILDDPETFISYGIKFNHVTLGPLPGTTSVTYLICSCNESENNSSVVQQLNFEVCSGAPTPIAAFTNDVGLNLDIMGDDQEVIGFPNFKVAGFPGSLFETSKCIELTLVYNGIIPELTGRGQLSVSIASDSNPTSSGTLEGVKIVGCPDVLECPDSDCDCNQPENANSCTVNFESCFTLPPFEDIQDLINDIRYDFCIGEPIITVDTCSAPAVIEICEDRQISCCVEVPRYKQTVPIDFIMFNIPVVGCRTNSDGSSLPIYVTCAQTNIVANQSCITAPGGPSPLNLATCDNVAIRVTGLEPVMNEEGMITGVTIHYSVVLPDFNI